MAKPFLLLLPGMDGTGDLLIEAHACLSKYFEVKIARYPKDECLDYEALVSHVAAQLPPREKILVVAESFSGPIGIMLAAREPRCTRLALCASFCQSPWPSWIPKLTQGWAKNLINNGPIPPCASIAPMTMGQWSTPEWQARIQKVSGDIAPCVLRQRLRMALDVDASNELKTLSVPTLYLQASCDRLVEPRYGQFIQKHIPHIQYEIIEGPHFLMQAQPELCAQSIYHWDKSL